VIGDDGRGYWAMDASDHKHWTEAEAATALGDEMPLTAEAQWLSRFRDGTLLALAVVTHAHGATTRQLDHATGHWYPSVRISLRSLERAGLVEHEPSPTATTHLARHRLWLATLEGTRLGITPYVCRVLDAAKPRFTGHPASGWSAGRFRLLGTEKGPPIFRPSWELAEVTDPQKLADVVRTGTHDDREFALAKLIALNEPSSVAALAEIAQICGSDEELARKATIALGSFATPDSVAALIDLAGHRDSWIREAAARSLGRVHAAQAIPTLEELLAYPNPQVRAAAVTALGRIGDQTARNAILPALADPQFVVRHCARHALITLGAADELRNNKARHSGSSATETPTAPDAPSTTPDHHPGPRHCLARWAVVSAFPTMSSRDL
jgi:hypothetical protein